MAFRNLELVLRKVEVGDSEGLLGRENTHTMSRAELLSPGIHMLKTSPLICQNVTVLRNRIFKEVNSVKMNH